MNGILEKEGKNTFVIENIEEFDLNDYKNTSIFHLKLNEVVECSDFETRSEKLMKILEDWDLKLRNLLLKLDDSTGIILISSIGDQNYAD